MQTLCQTKQKLLVSIRYSVWKGDPFGNIPSF